LILTHFAFSVPLPVPFPVPAYRKSVGIPMDGLDHAKIDGSSGTGTE